MIRNHLNYRFILIGLGACLVAFLVFRFVAPFGSVVSYQFNVNKDTGKITKVAGIENVESFENGSAKGTLSLAQQVIRKNVARFQLKLISKTIDGIWVKLRFKGNPKEIKVGVRGSTNEKYSYTPLYNQAIESLTWNHINNGSISLWQKNRVFTAFDTFTQNPPKDKTIATYFVDPASLFMTTTNQGAENVTINSMLRGTHTFYVEVTKKPFVLDVSKQDANTYLGGDSLSIQVYKGDQKLTEKVIPDDGITGKNNLMATPQKEEIKLDNSELGVYKVILKDNSYGSDIRITNITVNQPKLVFTSVFPLGSIPTTLITNSKKVQMSTAHPKSTQVVKLDDSYNLDVLKDKQKDNFDLDQPASGSANIRGLHKLVLPKNDLSISGDGLFAFSGEAFFDPQTIKTVDVSNLSDIAQADYIVANYAPVTKDGDWLEAQVFIDPKNIKVDGNTLYFSIESPGLESSGGEINVDSLEITTTKPSWFGNSIVANNPSTEKSSIWQRFTSWISTFGNGKH